MTTFDYVVPVGCNCRNTWNLRRHFGFGNGFPFDWWITPLPALLSLLQKFDIAYLYAPELLEAVSSEDGSISSIRHRELGIFFHHEFPRAWKTPGTPVLPNWRDHLQIPISRTVALRDRFLALRGRILFVRNMAITDESPDPIYPLLNALFHAKPYGYSSLTRPVESSIPNCLPLHFQMTAPSGAATCAHGGSLCARQGSL
jgi:hypothetical protein